MFLVVVFIMFNSILVNTLMSNNISRLKEMGGMKKFLAFVIELLDHSFDVHSEACTSSQSLSIGYVLSL